MSELSHYEPSNLPVGARQVGVRVKPALRLAIGFKDPEKRGAPTKTDYFIAKPGQDGENARAAAKFTEVYGERPKAVEIRLPGEFGDALDIRYKAFAGGGDNGGGVMTAKGDTNFALYDYVGGPDTLTIWRQDGSVEEVQTAGLDATTGEPLDEIAAELKLGLYTTFRFGIPNVLGYGSHAEITSKGKATTDTLWFKLRGFYGTFGHRTSFVLRPTLIVKPATARPVVKNKETGAQQRIKSRIYVLDLIPTETEDEMLERFREHRELTASATESLYGGQPRELDPVRELEDDVSPEAHTPITIQGPQASSAIERDIPATQTPAGDADSVADRSAEQVEETPEAAVEEPPPLALAPEPPLEGEYEDPSALTPAEEAALSGALQMKVPMGSYQGMSLTKLLTHGESAHKWIAYGLRKEWGQDPGFHDALALIAKAEAPDIYAEWVAERSGS